MEELTVVITAAILSMTGLVSVALWLSHSRQMKQFEQQNLNYRAELRSNPSHLPASGPEPSGDIATTLLQFVATPEGQALIQQFMKKPES